MVSEPVYLIYSVLAIGAGYFGGLEHVGGEEGALRGFTGGLLFGTFILLAKEVSGSDAEGRAPGARGAAGGAHHRAGHLPGLARGPLARQARGAGRAA